MDIHKQTQTSPSAPKGPWNPGVASYEEANQRIESLLESITDAFVAVDREWRLTYVNKTAAQLIRKSRHELLGKWAESSCCQRPKNPDFTTSSIK